MEHRNHDGAVTVYDFSRLPVPAALQRSLAVLFAARCRAGVWGSHATSTTAFREVGRFCGFLTGLDDCPPDLDRLTAAQLEWWHLAKVSTPGGSSDVRSISALLREDVRLQDGPVAEALARRVTPVRGEVASYGDDEFTAIKRVARHEFRAAVLRIEASTRALEAWRAGGTQPGSPEHALGEVLEVIARTGDVPREMLPSGKEFVPAKIRRALGGAGGRPWRRLFLSRTEAVSLGVLLMAEFGWNLAVIDRLRFPRAEPDPSRDGAPVYRIPVEKRRRGPERWHETENAADLGPRTPGRLITQALAATVHARAAVAAHDPAADYLLVSRTALRTISSADRERLRVGPFVIGISYDDVRWWHRRHGLSGSPFQRGRRTVVVRGGRGPAQHSQRTYDVTYVLADQRTRTEARPVIAAGAEAALQHARAALAARLAETADPTDQTTATADCHDPVSSAWPGGNGGCAASFLLCLGCANARVHPGHHPRLAHLDRALANLRSTTAPTTWDTRWAEHHERLQDLWQRLGPAARGHALTAVTDTDRAIVDHLLAGDLNP
ncbi:hypothetical protein ABZ568_25950 [Streptomyces olindensis]|uniref:Integrase n=1 Tax=Streptomyces olindensis TaxID=358823 RepID=A0ABV2Y0J9_9ACTN